jgi:hypothetical protein
VPHDLVHVAQALNADVTQWIGHGPWSHTSTSVRFCAHALPPLATSVVIVRERDFVPSPQDLEHGCHASQSDKTQSTGQACWLQERASVPCAHALPPFAGAVIVRERCCVPVSQDWLHAPHVLHVS